MANKELTPEQKSYMSGLAGVTPKYSVGQLRKIKNAFLQGISIRQVEEMFSSDVEESRMEQLIEQFGNATSEPEEREKTEAIDKVEEKMEVSEEIPLMKKETPNRNARAEPKIEKVSDEDKQEPDEEMEVKVPEQKPQPAEMSEETETVLTVAKDIMNQLKELKEFIHKSGSVMEAKDKKIALLQEENEKLKEDLQHAIRAAPLQGSGKTAVAVKARKGWLGFWKKSNNYMIRLFSNPKFTADQIAEIRLGLEADLQETQIKSYAKPEISARQMKEIRMVYELQNQKEKN